MTDYYKQPGINASSLKMVLKSPYHYKHGYRERGSQLDFGRLAHILVLEPDKIKDQIAVTDLRRNTKAYKAFEEENSGKKIVKQAEFDLANDMAAKVRNHYIAGEIVKGGEHEISLSWQLGETLCKGRVDGVNGTTLYDYKTTTSAAIDSFSKSIKSYRYALSMAWYKEGAIRNGYDIERVVLIAQEKTIPYAVQCFELSEQTIREGWDDAMRALDLLEECQATGVWPTYYDGVYEI